MGLFPQLMLCALIVTVFAATVYGNDYLHTSDASLKISIQRVFPEAVNDLSAEVTQLRAENAQLAAHRTDPQP